MKKVQRVIKGVQPHWVGNGFHVQSLFSYHGPGRELSPFLLLDYAAPHDFAPGQERRGVEAHPHRGFETVTIAYQGEVEHRDSSGGGGRIGPGDVQWMTAGGGIVHEEFHAPEFTRDGGTFEMVQLWVNLPARDKGAAPGYQSIPAATIPEVALGDGAGTVRVIAGEVSGTRGPARTFTPVGLFDAQTSTGGDATIPVTAGQTAAVLVIRGEIELSNGERASAGELAVFSREESNLNWKAVEDSRMLVMTGEPIDEPVVGYGPFVMNTEREIREAISDYQAGAMGEIA